MPVRSLQCPPLTGRSSPEERGLKFPRYKHAETDRGRSSPEERGLKYIIWQYNLYEPRRSSPEERGLKSVQQCLTCYNRIVAPHPRSVD